MDEFGESPSFYIWPIDHEEGTAFPDDFRDRLRDGLRAVGLDYEAV